MDCIEVFVGAMIPGKGQGVRDLFHLSFSEETADVDFKLTSRRKEEDHELEFSSTKSIRTPPNLFGKIDEKPLKYLVEC